MLNNKLNPPQISATLPAFIYEDNELTVPFNLNRAVGENEFNKIAILVRSVQTGVEKYQSNTDLITYDSEDNIWKAKFVIEDSFAQVGQYYKIQIAFVSSANDSIGYYSSVGVIKCIAKPTTYIESKNSGSNICECTGVYTSTDISEKVYSYCFNLYDDNILIASSGEQIHNNSKDNYQQSIVESIDTWTVRKSLIPNKSYKIGYLVTTLNGYVTKEVYNTITVKETIFPKIHASLSAINKPEDGYIEISLIGNRDNAQITGSFILLRSSSENNFDTWDDLGHFKLFNWNSNNIKFIHRDYAVQQGHYYKYAIQAYNEYDIYSKKLLNKEGPVFCDFEDIFLFDGNRQLKIRFNPKVSTFKPVILESKTDTIGNKYPFIFRNGIVGYKEFQISGLLSILGDENDMFLTGLPHLESEEILDSAFQLTATNYQREREFKLQVLKWLTNGKPKLFKSSAEGNYIVQLMNVNLTPTDALGRMLHTFNSAAYEIADYNFDNIKSYGLISTMETMSQTPIAKMGQISLVGKININIPQSYKVSICASPNIEFSYTLSDDQSYYGNTGITGVFNVPESVLKDNPLKSISLESESWITDGDDNAVLLYEYVVGQDDTFQGDKIQLITSSNKVIQIVGTGTTDQELEDYDNLIEQESDIRTKVGTFSFLRIAPRPIVQIYQDGEKYYSVESSDLIEKWNPLYLYEIMNLNSVKYIDGNNPSILISKPSYWFKLVDKEGNLISSDIELVKINRETVATQSYFQTSDYYDIGEMYVGNGLYIDAVFENVEIAYAIENYEPVLSAKEKWYQSKLDYEINVGLLGVSSEDIVKQALKTMNQAYEVFLDTLSQELQGDVNYAI